MAIEEAEDGAMDTTELIAGHDSAVGNEHDLHSFVLARFGKSEAPEHRHLVAVVSAMADVIREQGLPSSPTAFFAATMSALERQCKTINVNNNNTIKHKKTKNSKNKNKTDSKIDGDDDSNLIFMSNNTDNNGDGGDDHVSTALCTFLAMVLPKVPHNVLRSKGGEGLSILVGIVENANASAGTLKHGFTCIVVLLRAADKSDWASLGPAFNAIVKYCFDPRPRVRKRAHECTAEALRVLQGSISLTMASDVIVTLFEKLFLAVSQTKEENSSDKSSGKSDSGAALQILYLLNALKLLLPLMSGKSIGRLLVFFTKLLELRQTFLSRQILNTLHPLFSNSVTDIPSGILTELLEKLSGMISEDRKAGDENMVAARVLRNGMEKLNAIDPKACALKLPLVFQSLAGMLAFQQEEAVYAAGDCLKGLIEKCIDNSMIEQGNPCVQSQGKSPNVGPSIIGRVCVIACSLLGYQYSSAWDVSLQVVTALFNKLGETSFTLMSDTIQALADLEALSDENITCRKQLHRSVGAAIAAMGPDKFLKLLPLQLDSADFSNARVWLLPILRQNIIGSELKYFSDKIVPVIRSLEDKIKKFSAEGKPTTAKKAEALVQSLWMLFPAFCNYPSDTQKNFGLVAKAVGSVLSEEHELRGVICRGLQMLIRQNKDACGDTASCMANQEDSVEGVFPNKAAEERVKALYTEMHAKANLAAIASFSRNFLPLLFNIFIASAPEKRGVLQDTIGDFASISEKKVVKDFFVSIMQKLLKATKEAAEPVKLKGADPMDLSGPKKEESASSRRCIFMDLALSLLHGLDDESVGILFTAVKPTLQDPDGTVQKKGYKVLAGLCKESVGFLDRKSSDVLELLLVALPICHFSAKRHRLSCLHPLILHVFRAKMENGNGDKVLSSFVGEIILATKESNIKTRNTAYDILVQVGHSLKDADPFNSDGKLLEFFTMIVGCLAGTTPHMQSAAITGLARLIYEFHDLCHTIPDLLPSALLLLHTKSREVIKSVLGFLKVVAARQPVEHLQEHLKSMVEGLLLWSDDSKNHFKAKVRVLFEMLVRKCGLQAVSAVTPEPHAKLITHIRKMKERKEKEKQKKGGDENQSVKSHATSGRQSKWQHTEFFDNEEGSDDEDMEDLDTSTVALSKQSRTTMRSARKLRKSNKMLPEDDFDGETEPLDLLDAQKTRSVLSTNKLKRKNDDSDDDLEIDLDGRFIVPDENMMKKKRASKGKDDVDMQSTRSGKSNGKMKSNGQGSKKRKIETGWAYTGEEYTNKKGNGKGDMKREGKLDPYAYWPLDPKMMNRRSGKKAAARKGLMSITQMTRKMKGLSASEALNIKGKSMKGKRKVHKGKSKKK